MNALRTLAQMPHGGVKYREYADACRRLSWLNTDSKQVCDLAILCEASYLPDKSAKTCYQHQLDFNYLEIRHLWEDAKLIQRVSISPE